MCAKREHIYIDGLYSDALHGIGPCLDLGEFLSHSILFKSSFIGRNYKVTMLPDRMGLVVRTNLKSKPYFKHGKNKLISGLKSRFWTEDFSEKKLPIFYTGDDLSITVALMYSVLFFR